jgi:CheY-like chemotaxis protein
MMDAQRYETLEVSDGEAALLAARAAKPDVIVLDVNMPKRDGYSVLEELSRDDETRRIPVIMSTSLILSERDRARLFHSQAILSKAALSTELVSEMLSDALRQNRGRRDRFRPTYPKRRGSRGHSIRKDTRAPAWRVQGLGSLFGLRGPRMCRGF